MPETLTRADIRKASLKELEAFMMTRQEKPFKARQVSEWLWKKSARTFDQMTNLSVSLRRMLSEQFVINAIEVHRSQVSSDGTVKMAFRLHDGHLIEGVLIPADDRMTACVSSQVGCSLTCKFCATGYMDRKRNLDPAEIYDQVVEINRVAMEQYQQPLSNIVFMGMGEPLLNYANVQEGIRLITSPEGLNMSAKRITVSTAGVAKMIRKLGEEQVKYNLALSLHAANDLKRNQIMPINETNNLEVLREALKYYFAKTKNPVTYEYIVFNKFNDTIQDAEELYRFTRHLPCKVNIIEYNPIQEADFANAEEDRFEQFCGHLRKKGVNVNVRRSRGKDIDAACGQLANKN